MTIIKITMTKSVCSRSKQYTANEFYGKIDKINIKYTVFIYPQINTKKRQCIDNAQMHKDYRCHKEMQENI